MHSNEDKHDEEECEHIDIMVESLGRSFATIKKRHAKKSPRNTKKRKVNFLNIKKIDSGAGIEQD